MLSEDNKRLIEYERLKSVFQHAPLTLSVTVANGSLTALILAQTDGAAALVGWVAAMAAVSAVRWAGARRFLSHRRALAESSRRWALFSILGALATGVLWGIGATALFPASPSHQLYLALVISGMCAGAVTVGAAHMPTVTAFILPASLPLAASLFAQGPEWQVAALMVVIFAAALSAVSLASHRAFGDRVQMRIALDLEQRKLAEATTRLLEAVTQRRTAEAALHQAQKMEAIGHLTGGIAHDFNNLLQVMIGNIDLIRRLSADNPRIFQYARAAEQAAMRGAKLTSSLLTFARRQTLEPEPVDINHLLREFEPILLRTLGGMVRFEIALAPHLPQCLADPAHFQSAILNLVINARDAMPEGGILAVTTNVATLGPTDLTGNPDAASGDFVSVSVRDTGTGMSAEVMAQVFEPFFTTKEPGKGTGLGLSQVYGFARQSRGHVGLDSAPGEGTVATLWLPVATAPSDIPGTTATDLPAAPGLHRDHVQAFR